MRAAMKLPAVLLAVAAACGGTDTPSAGALAPTSTPQPTGAPQPTSSPQPTGSPQPTDHAPAFTGAWNLAVRVTGGGISQSQSVRATATSAQPNAVQIAGVCADALLQATATSATHLVFEPATCHASGPCFLTTVTYTLQLEQGTADLAQGALDGTLRGTASGCGSSVPYTITFSGQRTLQGNAAPAVTAAEVVAAVAGASLTR